MSNTSRKIHSRRRLAAFTFLSNISLDGTHRDTNLCNLNFNLQYNKSVKNQSLQHKDKCVFKRSAGSIDIEIENTKAVENAIVVRSFDFECKKFYRRESEGKINDVIYRIDEQLPPKSRDRVQKFVSDAKAKLCNLSQKKKQLSHQKSIDSYGLPSGKSTESLGGCRSRKASLCPSECSITIPSVAEIKYIKTLKDHKYGSERMVLVTEKKSPVVLFSVLPYYRSQVTSKGDSKQEGSRRRHASSRQLSIIADGPDPFDLLGLIGVERPKEGQLIVDKTYKYAEQCLHFEKSKIHSKQQKWHSTYKEEDISYGELLSPSYLPRKLKNCDSLTDPEFSFRFPYQIHAVDHMTRMPFKLSSTPPKTFEKCLERDEGMVQTYHRLSAGSIYHPNLLDDPEFIAGKHSTLLVFPSYITSVIDYVKPSDLKKDLNDKFKERFPHIQLTLSKLRSLKREMYKIAKVECNMDLSIVAQAFVYFEKLVLKVLINKQNRKLCAGACLLLSAKLNDVNRNDLQTLVEKIETIFRINRKDLMCSEFGVLIALEFSLLLNATEILPHYQRLGLKRIQLQYCLRAIIATSAFSVVHKAQALMTQNFSSLDLDQRALKNSMNSSLKMHLMIFKN